MKAIPTTPQFPTEVNLCMLNEYQQTLVREIGIGGIVIGEACPGSGKTATMEQAIAHLITNLGIHPSRIGVFTFSNKSAAEARRRIAQTIMPELSQEEIEFLEKPDTKKYDALWIAADPKRQMIVNWVCTIHALSYRLLKASGEELKVLSGEKQLRWDAEAIVKDGLKELDWEESPKAVWHWVSKAINDLVVPADSLNWFRIELTKVNGPIKRANDLAELYSRYYKFMKKHNLVDFDMMQARVVYKIRTRSDFRVKLGSMFDYIIIDEAQDNSASQNEILSALCSNGCNMSMLGDIMQAMYSFRGAVPEILTSIENARRFNLPVNYRSTQTIIQSSAIFSIDAGDTKPFLHRDNAPVGESITYIQSEDFNSLNNEIASLIKSSESEPKEWAILSRTRAECSAIHTGLIAAGIPATNHSGGLIFGSLHIRKVLAYAMLACNYNDARNNLEVLTEIANVASRDFKAPMTRRRHEEGCQAKPWQNCGCPVVMEEGMDYSPSRFYGQKAIQNAGSWQGILSQRYDKNRGGYPSLESKGARDLVSFVEKVEKLQDDAKKSLELIISDCVAPWLAHEEGLSEEDLSENGKEEDFALLLDLITPGMTLEDFLKKVDWLSSSANQEVSKNSVNVGTIHWSKGAEFERVIVNTTRLPLVINFQPKPDMLPVGKPPTIEEERRLMFVAMTRAKNHLYLMASSEWLKNKVETSKFVTRLIEKDVIKESSNGIVKDEILSDIQEELLAEVLVTEIPVIGPCPF
jgi:DNA helicase-2/ATP-dependent DNA helicase PcrA